MPLASRCMRSTIPGRKLGAPVSVNGLIYPKVQRVSETWRAYLLGREPDHLRGAMIKLTKIAGKLEPCLWVLVMAALGLFSVHSAGVRIYNDSYQYLSVAEVIRTQGKIATSIVFFDTERARGILPAPETTAPPGYPVAIDSLLWAHLSPETYDRVQGQQLLKLHGTADDIVGLGLFLASDEGRFINCEIVHCDAGNRLRGWRG